MTTMKKQDSESVTFDYQCVVPDCGAEGTLTLLKADGMKPFGCPEGCGATYIPWKNPLHHGAWELKCVVEPVYR